MQDKLCAHWLGLLDGGALDADLAGLLPLLVGPRREGTSRYLRQHAQHFRAEPQHQEHQKIEQPEVSDGADARQPVACVFHVDEYETRTLRMRIWARMKSFRMRHSRTCQQQARWIMSGHQALGDTARPGARCC